MHATYARVRAALESREREELIESGDLHLFLNQLASHTTNFSSAIERQQAKDGIEGRQISASTAHWGAVKTWELMHEFGLEDLAPRIYGPSGEARSWMSTRRNVFELAPHRSADNKANFDHQSVLVGKFKSTVWYQLQLTLNAGNRQGISL